MTKWAFVAAFIGATIGTGLVIAGFELGWGPSFLPGSRHTNEATMPSPTTSGARVSATPGPTTTSRDDSTLSAAEVEVRNHGFAPADVSGFNTRLDLRVIVGNLPGTADAPPEQAFFFWKSRFLGTDTSEPSAAVRIAWQNNDTVAVQYMLYHLNDARCCPTAGAMTVRYQWNGTRLVPLDPIPDGDPQSDPHR